jgi:hypothetical protein
MLFQKTGEISTAADYFDVTKISNLLEVADVVSNQRDPFPLCRSGNQNIVDDSKPFRL